MGIVKNDILEGKFHDLPTMMEKLYISLRGRQRLITDDLSGTHALLQEDSPPINNIASSPSLEFVKSSLLEIQSLHSECTDSFDDEYYVTIDTWENNKSPSKHVPTSSSPASNNANSKLSKVILLLLHIILRIFRN
jgi:hypothetical protein